MKGIYKIELFGEKLDLLPQKAIYLPLHKTLLASDLQLGKAGHFRKAGIAVPVQLASTDLDKLSFILNKLDIERLIIAGDLSPITSTIMSYIFCEIVSSIPIGTPSTSSAPRRDLTLVFI